MCPKTLTTKGDIGLEWVTLMQNLNRDICLAIALCEGKSQFMVKTGEAKACTQGNFLHLRDPRYQSFNKCRRKYTVHKAGHNFVAWTMKT